MAGFIAPSTYASDELKKAIEKANRNSSTSDKDDDSPDPNYACQSCGEDMYIDDHEKHTPSWCTSCERIQMFKRNVE